MNTPSTKGSVVRWAIAILVLLLVYVLVSKWGLNSPDGQTEKLSLKPSQEELRSARGNTDALRTLVQKFPDDWECQYWLAVDMVHSETTVDELLEAGKILNSIPPGAKPEWLAAWRKRQMARVAITLFDAQQLPVSADSFQQDLVARLDRAKLDLQSVSGDKVREDLTQLKQLLVERWAYVEEKAVQTGRPLSEAFAERLAEIKPRMSAPEAVQLLERFIADMSDGHSYLSCGGVERLGLPFRMRDTSDGVVIEAFHPEAANLERGDRVASISDLPIEKWIACQKEITSCSTAAARRAWAIRNMSTMLVRNENQNDQSQSIESVIVAVERDGDLKRVDCKLTGEGSWASADSQVWLQTKDLSSRTGYIKVQSWSPEIVGADSEAASRLRTDIDRAIDKYMSASAIVVDIRGNRGGYDWLCTYFASHFIKAPFPVYALRYRLNDQGFGNVNLEPTLSGVTYAAYKGECFAGQIYVLVDENCFSASDVFLSVVKAQLPDRATLIGRPNAGGVGGPNLMGTLKHTGAAVTMSRCKAFHCNGSKLLEGTSAEIDYLIEWTRQDILKSRDPDLEKALALIEAEFTVE